MTDQSPDTPRDFTDFLHEQSRGATHTALTDGLRELVARVKDTDRPGTLTLIIKVEPLKGTHGLGITDEIRLKLPDYQREGSVMFTDRNGDLVGDDPKQLAGFEIDRRTGEILGTP
jgi:hypothetical protein